MKLWLLRPVEGLDYDNNPWIPWYDKAFGFIVRAETEEQAREFAHAEAGSENMNSRADMNAPWKDEKYSSCVELTGYGTPGVVMEDFASA